MIKLDQGTIEKLETVKSSAPLLIVGCPRSGTTLLLRLIRDYLDVGFGRDDGRFLRFKNLLNHYGDLNRDENMFRLMRDIFADDDFRKRFKSLAFDPKELLAVIDERTYSELVRHVYAAFALMEGKTRWGNKTPRYVFHMGELLDLFPDAKFIHVIRDGRDVALSLFRVTWGAPRNCFSAAKYWKERSSAARAAGAVLGEEKYLEVKYERLLSNPVSVFQKIIDFGSFEVDRDQVIERLRDETRARLKRDNFDKWRTDLSVSEIKVFEQVAGDTLKEFGYELQHPDLIGKPIRTDKVVYYHLHNFFTRAVKEGTAGVSAKLKRQAKSAGFKLQSSFGPEHSPRNGPE